MTEDAATRLLSDVGSLDGIGQFIADAYRRCGSARREWRDATIDLANGLLKAREQFPADKDFGTWVNEQIGNRTLNEDSRAALINMARHPEVMRRVIEETDRWSYRMIWEHEVKPFFHDEGRFRSVTKPAGTNPESPIAPDKPQIPDETENVAPIATKNRTKPRAHPYLGHKERANEVLAVFGSPHTKAALSKVCGKTRGTEIWHLILLCLDQGFIRQSNASTNERITARLLFTGASSTGHLHRLDLANAKDRAVVNDSILPVAMACRDAILAAPERVEQLIENYQRQQVIDRQARQLQEQTVKALAVMRKDETEVIMFDRRFWPRMDNLDYSYSDLATATFFFDQLYRMARFSPNNSPGSCGRIIRHANKWPLQHATRTGNQSSRNVYQLVAELSRAMEKKSYR